MAHGEKTLAVRAERSRASGEVEAQAGRAVAFDFAALRSGRTETGSTASEEVCESRVVRFS